MRATRDLMTAAVAAEDMSAALDAARALFCYLPRVYPEVIRLLTQIPTLMPTLHQHHG